MKHRVKFDWTVLRVATVFRKLAMLVSGFMSKIGARLAKLIDDSEFLAGLKLKTNKSKLMAIGKGRLGVIGKPSLAVVLVGVAVW